MSQIMYCLTAPACTPKGLCQKWANNTKEKLAAIYTKYNKGREDLGCIMMSFYTAGPTVYQQYISDL